MIALGDHWEFIAAAYVGAVLVVGGLVGWTLISARMVRARVAVLEAARQARRQQ